ncbi:hypothetical protein [Burkholderia cenocepacia]|uniref:hypothetical protein n=1 Tax=Burkholderia cenocepacia TaxID=95486 RepID=UPI002AC330F0|nr:hypothetical protein [Burkholderia cenocepacia]
MIVFLQLALAAFDLCQCTFNGNEKRSVRRSIGRKFRRVGRCLGDFQIPSSHLQLVLQPVTLVARSHSALSIVGTQV